MDWKENCLPALDKEKMFHDSAHRTRFKELMDCYSGFPFFNKGVCKCMYLAAWDDEHFAIMLETLSDMSLGKDRDTTEMSIKGDALAEEQDDSEYYVYRPSLSFLDGRPYQIGVSQDMSHEVRLIIRRALQAAAIIDKL